MADPKAIQLFEQIYAKVDAQARGIIKSMLPDVNFAAQDDGSVIANDHRIVNFQGPGVTVSDEPALRRVNVFVPGAPVANSTNTYGSSTSAKARSLWVAGGSGSVSLSYTATGSEGGGAGLGSTALPAFTGNFTVTISCNQPNPNILNMDVIFRRSSTSTNCWVTSMSLIFQQSTSANWTVGVPSGSWSCSDWDTLAWGMSGATDHLVAGTTYTVTITAAGLSGGSGNNPPPANWDQPSYSDTAWSAAVVAGTDAGEVPPSGSSAVWATAAPTSNNEEVLFRHTFSLPTGTIASASLDLAANDTLADGLTHINGRTTSTPVASAGALRTFSISPSMLTPGAPNLLAFWGKNINPTHAWVGWKLTVNYVTPGTDSQYIPWSVNTTKGDIIVGTGAATGVRQGVGSDGQVLTARSTSSSGVAWEAGGGGLTLPLTQNLTFNPDNTYDVGASSTANRPRNIYAGSQVLAAPGSAAAPGYAFGSGTGYGLYLRAGVALTLSFAGTPGFDWQLGSAPTYAIGANARIGWSNNNDPTLASPDLVLLRGQANVLAQRNGSAAQAVHLFNTYTDASNYERMEWSWSGNNAYLWTVQAGTGAARTLFLGTNGNARLGFVVNAAERWRIDNATYMLAASVDNTYDIGASGGLRPRDLFLGRNLQVGGQAKFAEGGIVAFRAWTQTFTAWSTTTTAAWVAVTPLTATATCRGLSGDFLLLDLCINLQHTVANAIVYVLLAVDADTTGSYVAATSTVASGPMTIHWQGYKTSTAGSHTFQAYVYLNTAGTLNLHTASYSTLRVVEVLAG